MRDPLTHAHMYFFAYGERVKNNYTNNNIFKKFNVTS